MPNIDFKAHLKTHLIDLFWRCVAQGVSLANDHVADPERADCPCQLHRQAKIDAALATPPVTSPRLGGTSTRSPSPSPKPRKAPSRAGDKKLPPV